MEKRIKMTISKTDLFSRASAFGHWPSDTQGGLFRRVIPLFDADDGSGDPDPNEDAAKKAAEEAATAKAAEEAAKKAAEEAAKKAGNKDKPDDETAKLVKEVMTLKNKLKAETAAKEELAKKFEGMDPEQMRALIAEAQKAEEEKLRAAGDYDALKKRMAEEHQREMAKALAEKDTTKSELEAMKNTITELTIGNAFASSAFLKEETVMTPSKARLIYASHFDIEDGNVVPYDKPRGDSSRSPLVDARGATMGFDEAMRRIIEADPDRDHLLRAKSKPGPGASNTPNLRKPAGNDSANQPVGIDRIAAALAAGKLNKQK
jgi:hypothetical protein